MIKFLTTITTILLISGLGSANIIDNINIKTYETIEVCNKEFEEKNIKQAIQIDSNIEGYNIKDYNIILINSYKENAYKNICVFYFDYYIDN